MESRDIISIKFFKNRIFKKILVCGDTATGKTTLLYRHIYGKFRSETQMTNGVEFFTRDIFINDQKITHIFWDLAGVNRCRFFQEAFCRGADAAIITFDLCRYDTLFNVERWINFCRHSNQNLPILLVGLKSDLHDYFQVNFDLIGDLLYKYNLIDYFSISCKIGKNFEKLFYTVFNIINKIEEKKKKARKEREKREKLLLF